MSETQLPISNDISILQDNRTTAQLKGQMNTFTLTMTVLAFTAPLVVVSGFSPFIIAAGGIAAPVGFIITMTLMVLFSMGFLTMAKYSKDPEIFTYLLGRD